MLRGVRVLTVVGFVVAAIFPVKAAVVVAPTFEEMVRDARQILVTETMSTRAAWRSSAEGRFIETTVTFRVDAVIKGSFAREQTLTFLGGQIGDVRLDVSDQVQFTRGDRDVLFISGAGDHASPLVGYNHGRFRIGAGDVVLSHDGLPLGIEVNRATGSGRLLEAPATQGLTLNTFLAHVRATAAAAGVNLR